MKPSTLALLAEASARIDAHTNELRARCSETTLLQFQALKRELDTHVDDHVREGGDVPAVTAPAKTPAAKKTARRGR